MKERTNKALSDYAAAQAADYLKDYCESNKNDLLLCDNCIFYADGSCSLAATGWDSFYPFEWRV